MANHKSKDDAFINIPRETSHAEPVEKRVTHFHEMYDRLPEAKILEQATRCMQCGTPFCHNHGCPLGNVIPEWNTLVAQNRWKEALDLLHSTNNFPEVTGRICPALCEAACTLTGSGGEPVTVRQMELNIVEKGWAEGWIVPMPPSEETGKSVAIIGAGPAGLAAAQQLRRAGHAVTVFEREKKPGGLLRYGIPNFKLEKTVLDRRIAQMEAEGVVFECGVEVGRDFSAAYLKRSFDAVIITIGAWEPRDLPVPGRDLKGVHFAMEFLSQQIRKMDGEVFSPETTIDAKGKTVVVIGGGDTGSDCLGTSIRQGAKAVYQFELLPKPPADTDPANPWPDYPRIYRTSTSHEEGGIRRWCITTKEFVGKDGVLTGLSGAEVSWSTPENGGRPQMQLVPGSDFEMECDIVLLAMGFVHAQHPGMVEDFGVSLDPRGNVTCGKNMMTDVDGVFVAGDANTGASLVVRGIAAGRRVAHYVDGYLMGESVLPNVPDLS